MRGASVTADAAWEQVLVAGEPSSRGPAGNVGRGARGTQRTLCPWTPNPTHAITVRASKVPPPGRGTPVTWAKHRACGQDNFAWEGDLQPSVHQPCLNFWG